MKQLLIYLIYLPIICGVEGRRNILFLAADDLRPNLGAYQDVNPPFYNSPLMYTPNLDALASKSMLFERAYCQIALCSPSRTSLLTSRRPDTTRVTRIGTYWRTIGGNFTTIPQFFKEKGYRTVGGGKIFHTGISSNHNDPMSWSDPYHEASKDGNGMKHSWKAFTKEELEIAPLQDTRETDFMIEKLREVAKNASSGEKPFFLALGIHKPHLPFTFPEEYLDYYPEEDIDIPFNPNCPTNMPEMAWNTPEISKYADCKPDVLGVPEFGSINITLPDSKTKELRRAYYAAVSYADHELGRIINELVDLNLLDDTLIVLWGDHGWQLGEHAEWGKLTNFEIANRVPLMIHVPGMTTEGMRTSKHVELIDLFPTLVELAGFEPLETCGDDTHDVKLCTEGSSLVPLLVEPETAAWKDAVFWQVARGGLDNDVPEFMGYSIYTDQFHYTEWVNIMRLDGYEYIPEWDNPADIPELYLTNGDIQENVNRYNDPEYTTIIEELSLRLHDGWRAALPSQL